MAEATTTTATTTTTAGVEAAASLDDIRMVKLREFCNTNEVPIAHIIKLRQLEDYDIVLVCDDSGSMKHALAVDDDESGHSRSHRKHRNHQQEHSRWDELRGIVTTVLELATCLDSNGVDVFFLNRPPVLNVTSSAQLQETFSHPPHGFTPIVACLDRVVSEKQQSLREKKLLVVLATDGIPTDNEGNAKAHEFTNWIKNKKPHNFFFSVLACTDQKNDVEYLDGLDEMGVPGIDVSDDYRAEKKEYKQKTGKTLTFGTYICKVMLGPIDRSFSEAVLYGQETRLAPATTVPLPAILFPFDSFPFGVKLTLYNTNHKHYLTADDAGHVTCHEAHPHENAHWIVERNCNEENDNVCSIKHCRTGKYLLSLSNGVNAQGTTKENSKFHLRLSVDGSIHWISVHPYIILGVTIFGQVGGMDSERNTRCRFRYEVIS